MEVVKSISLFGKELMRVERNRQGVFTYSFLDGGNDFVYNEKYLELSLCNPVLMTIVALRSRLYSQMEIKHVNSKGVVIENSPYVKLLNNPNYFQSKEDFFFQQMWFLSSAGYDYIYQKKAFANELPKAIYNLIPSEIDLNNAHKVNKFIVTEKDKKAFGERKIKYTLDSTTYELMLSDLIPLYDLSNGLTNNSFFQSQSRVKGIAKVLHNIDLNLKSKGTNLDMSSKYLGSNSADGNESQLKTDDRNAIERVISSKSLVLTNQSSLKVQHLVSDMKKLYLDEQFADDANKCLLAFEMNKNVLNYFSKDSTFDNQENGVISYIHNSIQTTAKNTMNSLSQQWGLMEKGEKLIASYDHLAVMQPVVNDKIKSFTEMQNAIKLGLENGTLTPTDAKKMSDEFKLKLGL
jgi:hypothetical protein